MKKYKDDALTIDNLAKLTFTKAALYETLRLYPSSSALATQALEDVAIGGQNINKGTTIILSTYVTHRLDKLWEHPNTFYPDHFVGQQLAKQHKYAFYPFGGGLHNCIGRHFVEMEMMIIIVSYLREFTFATHREIKEAASITLKPERDVLVSMTPNIT